MAHQPSKAFCAHRGHRERLKKRFMNTDGKDFSDHELLEMLLYHVIPRSDTNELSHRLLNEFGTLREVLYADPARIERVVGAGKSTATFFSLLFAIKKRIDTQKYTNTRFAADSLIKVGNFFVDYFRDSANEEFCAMLLDNSLRLISFLHLNKGSTNSTALDIRALAKSALNYNATYVILAHNHPQGKSTPSAEDRKLTEEIELALATVGVTLLEHLAVNQTGFAPTMYLKALGNKDTDKSNLERRFYNGF